MDRIRKLMREIKAVADEVGFDGKSWKGLSKMLNHRGVKPLQVDRWNESNASQLRNFYLKYEHLLSEAHDSQASHNQEPPISEARESHAADNGTTALSESLASPDADNHKPALLDAHDAAASYNRVETLRPDDHASHDAREADKPPWSDLEARMKEIAREVVMEMMPDYEHHIPQMMPKILVDMEYPPESGYIKGAGRGRRGTRRYERFTISIDQVLARLLTEELQGQGVSINRFFDGVLWNLFHHPRLSYMPEPEPDSEAPDDIGV